MQESKQEVTKVVSLVNNGVSSPLTRMRIGMLLLKQAHNRINPIKMEEEK